MTASDEKNDPDQKHEEAAAAHAGQAEDAPNDRNRKSNVEKPRMVNRTKAVLSWLNSCFWKIVEFLKSIDGLITAVATVAIAVVAYLQWETFENTDRTLRDTLETNKLEQQAFIFVKEIKWEGIGGDQPIWRANIFWENSGSTPARALETEIICRRALSIAADPCNQHAPVAAMVQSNNMIVDSVGVLGAKRSVLAGFCKISVQELLLVQRVQLNMTVCVKAKYKDIFNDTYTHITEYAHYVREITGDLNNPSSAISVVTGAFPFHNCTDEDCKKQK